MTQTTASQIEANSYFMSLVTTDEKTRLMNGEEANDYFMSLATAEDECKAQGSAQAVGITPAQVEEIAAFALAEALADFYTVPSYTSRIAEGREAFESDENPIVNRVVNGKLVPVLYSQLSADERRAASLNFEASLM